MVNIIDTHLEQYPTVKLVGKRYTNSDRDAFGSYGAKWAQWHENNWFEPLLGGGLKDISDNFVGAMRCTAEGFEYWIGVLLAEDDPVPAQYQSAVIPEGTLAVSFLYGKDGSPDIFGMQAHEACVAQWRDRGWCLQPDGWFFERYNCPRYTTPDEKGNVILDYCAYLAKE